MVETKIITLEELKAHTKKDALYILLHGKVYNVSKFIDEHPGGDEVILAETGKDATEAFEDVGHSDEAREILEGLYIGDFESGTPIAVPASKTTSNSTASPAAQNGSSTAYLVPLALLGVYFAWRFYSA